MNTLEFSGIFMAMAIVNMITYVLAVRSASKKAQLIGKEQADKAVLFYRNWMTKRNPKAKIIF